MNHTKRASLLAPTPFKAKYGWLWIVLLHVIVSSCLTLMYHLNLKPAVILKHLPWVSPSYRLMQGLLELATAQWWDSVGRGTRRCEWLCDEDEQLTERQGMLIFATAEIRKLGIVALHNHTCTLNDHTTICSLRLGPILFVQAKAYK